METSSENKHIGIWVSQDGKSMHAGISTKPGAGDEPQPYNTDDGRYVSFTVAASGGLSGGSEGRGKVTPPKDKYPPPPSAPKEPHLVYGIEDHTLRNPESGVMTDTAYSGKGKDRNKAASQDIENYGPIPEGNWRIEEITAPDYYKKSPLQAPVFRLIPDAETEKRVGKDGMQRKPNTFLIHGDSKDHDASQGCIIVDKPTRNQLRKHEGEWIRVTK